jgi:hypothetical protein
VLDAPLLRIAQLTVGQRLRFHLVDARAHCES